MPISFFSPQLKVSNEAKEAVLEELESHGVLQCFVEARQEIASNNLGLYKALNSTLRSASEERLAMLSEVNSEYEMPQLPNKLDWTECFRLGACLSYFAFAHNDRPPIPAVTIHTVETSAKQFAQVPAEVIYELVVACDSNLQEVLDVATTQTVKTDAQQRLVSMGAGEVQFLLDNQMRRDGLYLN